MTPDELLDELSVKIYEPPLSEFRASGRLRNSDDPRAVVTLLIDFETERSMNGTLNFLGNSSGEYAEETFLALMQVGALNCARVLRRILNVAKAAGITFEAVQKDRATLTYPVASWRATHGIKWAAAEKAIVELEDEVDEDEFWRCLKAYVTQHQTLLAEWLRS